VGAGNNGVVPESHMSTLQRSAVAIILSVSGMAGVSSFEQPAPPGAARLSIAELRTEYAANPVGIDAGAPRLSWRILADARGVAQTAY